jgi:hypothetical protein
VGNRTVGSDAATVIVNAEQTNTARSPTVNMHFLIMYASLTFLFSEMYFDGETESLLMFLYSSTQNIQKIEIREKYHEY